jgi:hypothetical protein
VLVYTHRETVDSHLPHGASVARQTPIASGNLRLVVRLVVKLDLLLSLRWLVCVAT